MPTNIKERYQSWKANRPSPLDRIIENEKIRAYSDDFGLVYYWTALLLGLILLFSQSVYIQQANQFYLYFDIYALLFLITNLRVRKDYGAKDGFLKLDHDDVRVNYFRTIIVGTLWSAAIYMVFVYVIWNPITSLISPTPAAIKEISDAERLELTFQVIRSIPLEEFVFRGLGMTLVVFLLGTLILRIPDGLKFRELATDAQEENKYVLKYRIVWIVAILITGIGFGLLHEFNYITEYFPYYPLYDELGGLFGFQHIAVPIIYLCMLGIMLGYFRYKWGLIPCIIVHILNNFLYFLNVAGVLSGSLFIFPM